MKIFEITIFGITFSPTYYALMYILWFIFAWIFMKKFYQFHKKEHLDDLFFLIGLWVILWWRFGYVFFYNFSFYLENLWEIFAIWKWGMSFHGGLLWVIVSVFIFAKKYNYSFWGIIDYLAVIAPVGLWFWRIWNFLNNELYWFPYYNWPFPMMIQGVPHFPSPLLEMLWEGIILWIVLWVFFLKKFYKKAWFLSWIFLLGYGLSRIIVEFVRLPDSHIGYLFGTNFLTIGMIYTFPMIIFGLFLVIKWEKYLRK